MLVAQPRERMPHQVTTSKQEHDDKCQEQSATTRIYYSYNIQIKSMVHIGKIRQQSSCPSLSKEQQSHSIIIHSCPLFLVTTFLLTYKIHKYPPTKRKCKHIYENSFCKNCPIRLSLMQLLLWSLFYSQRIVIGLMLVIRGVVRTVCSLSVAKWYFRKIIPRRYTFPGVLPVEKKSTRPWYKFVQKVLLVLLEKYTDLV